MTLDRVVMIFAGIVILAGLALAYLVHPWWLALCALAGVNLIVAGVTGFCPAAMVFRKLGVKPGPTFQ